MKPTGSDLLDNPTWEALTTKQAQLAQGERSARRYDPAIAPFAAVENMTPQAFDQLGSLLAPGESVLLQTLTAMPAIEGLQTHKLFDVLQMTDARVSTSEEDVSNVEQLNANAASEMTELAARTQPGPFSTRTIETGRYIGLRQDGRLIAMAGERMRLDGFVEISAVCVDDDHRGKGIAGRLMNILRSEIRQRGDVPFLHVRSDNASAIGLYRRIGFEDRKTFSLYRVTRPMTRTKA